METTESQFPEEKKRHGCVTAWLILLIVANSLTALTYLVANDMIQQNLPTPISDTMLYLLAVIGVCNVVFAVYLFKWKKWAFWGFIGSSVAATAINLSSGLPVGQSLMGLIGIAILYGILQIKQDGKSAWENLE